MDTNRTVKTSLLVGLLSVLIPVLAHATPGDAFDDTTYPTYAADATVVPGPIAGPKALAFDDASYSDAVTREQTGIAFALTGGPEPYAQDDTSYSAPSSPESNGAAAVAVARAP
jgi:hypothetical protein